jgi:hypothetical protein
LRAAAGAPFFLLGLEWRWGGPAAHEQGSENAGGQDETEGMIAHGLEVMCAPTPSPRNHTNSHHLENPRNA